MSAIYIGPTFSTHKLHKKLRYKQVKNFYFPFLEKTKNATVYRIGLLVMHYDFGLVFKWEVMFLKDFFNFGVNKVPSNRTFLHKLLSTALEH